VPNQYRNMRSTCESIGNGCLRVTLDLFEGYRGSTAVFHSSRGILRGLPQLIGSDTYAWFWSRRSRARCSHR
jgi:hypothetical protein